tara:strand:- start:1376 stop:1642 length:267 start_codon:yes stop_codon:yes gene_type:complete
MVNPAIAMTRKMEVMKQQRAESGSSTMKNFSYGIAILGMIMVIVQARVYVPKFFDSHFAADDHKRNFMIFLVIFWCIVCTSLILNTIY